MTRRQQGALARLAPLPWRNGLLIAPKARLGLSGAILGRFVLPSLPGGLFSRECAIPPGHALLDQAQAGVYFVAAGLRPGLDVNVTDQAAEAIALAAIELDLLAVGQIGHGLLCLLAKGLPTFWRVDSSDAHPDLFVRVRVALRRASGGQGVAIGNTDHQANHDRGCKHGWLSVA